MAEPIIRFYKLYDSLPPIAYADPSAMGSMPTDAFRYCEAMRVASSFGWYVFPPRDLTLSMSEGAVYLYEGGEWVLLKADLLDPSFAEEWRTKAPDDLAEEMPAFVTAFPFMGIVQIFSGYFVETAPGWSIAVRGPVNFPRRPYQVFEGIIETDRFRPCPLFVNIQLLEPGREVPIPASLPLFQVQPVSRAAYADAKQLREEVVEVSAKGTAFDWSALKDTLHLSSHAGQDRRARYAIASRKRKKEE